VHASPTSAESRPDRNPLITDAVKDVAARSALVCARKLAPTFRGSLRRCVIDKSLPIEFSIAWADFRRRARPVSTSRMSGSSGSPRRRRVWASPSRDLRPQRYGQARRRLRRAAPTARRGRDGRCRAGVREQSGAVPGFS